MENEIIQQSTPKQTWVTFLTHFVCLGVLFFLPEVVMNLNSPRHDGIPTGIYVKFVVYIIVFYLNYYLIIDRCLNKKNSTYKIIGYNVLVLIGAIVVLYITWRLTAADHPMHIESNHQPFPESLPMTKPGEVPPPPPHELMTQPGEMQHFIQALTTILRDVIILIMAMALSVAIKLNNRRVKYESYRQQMIASQREEELKSLKNQLNPHFLFNTLNIIYALIDVSPQKAKHAVHEISHLLRYVLYENPSIVTLAQELKFVSSYIELMKLRIGDKMPINVLVSDGGCGEMPIAPLTFISIIENVFKHGNTGNKNHAMEIEVIADAGVVKCRTSNYFMPESLSQSTSEGIGLANLRRRLNLIYGDNAQLETKKSDDQYIVELIINLNNSK